MTDEQLAEIEERLRAATPGPWQAMRQGNQYIETDYLPTAKVVGASVVTGLKRPWNPHAYISFGMRATTHEEARFTDADADFIAHAPTDIAALIAEVKRLREALRQACTCATCNGAGEIDFVTGYKDNGPNDPIEVYALDECPECAGQKIGSHVEESTARVLEDCR